MAEENDESKGIPKAAASISTSPINVSAYMAEVGSQNTRGPPSVSGTSDPNSEFAVLCEDCRTKVRPGTGGFCPECGKPVGDIFNVKND